MIRYNALFVHYFLAVFLLISSSLLQAQTVEDSAIGKIDSIQGEGSILIIRATGERVIAQEGDVLLAGDTLAASDSASVTISLDPESTGLEGFVSFSGGEMARFDNALFDSISTILSDSSSNTPVAIGTKASPEVVRAMNETVPDSITSNANQDSVLGETSLTETSPEEEIGLNNFRNNNIDDPDSPPNVGQSLPDSEVLDDVIDELDIPMNQQQLIRDQVDQTGGVTSPSSTSSVGELL